MLSIIDTHLHMWDLNKFKLAWLEGIEILNRDFLLKEYLKVSQNHFIDKMIYMEVDCDKNEKLKEADYIVELSRDPKNNIAGAVCSGVLGEMGFKDTLRHYQKYNQIKGIRHVLHVPQYPQGYCLSDSFLSDLKKVFDANLLFDICIRPAELDDTVTLVDKFPEGKFILDHCGNPNPLLIAEKIPQPEKKENDIFWHNKEDWLTQISQLGKRGNVICKISGIIARVNVDNFHPDDLKPVVDHCLDCFGEDRVIFGGDWPVCELTMGLDVWISSLKEILKDRSKVLKEKIFYKNAKLLYGL